MDKYVTYYRVSTKMQGEDGNGMKAQAVAVRNFLSSKDAEEVAFFREVESGSDDHRPALRQAIQMCKDNGAKLLVAKLDRLSRSIKFLFTLKEELESAGVGFVFVDNPDMANNTMVLGVMATMAQHEREKIAERTKEALEARREEKGEWREGRTFSDEERQKAAAVRTRNAHQCQAWRRAFWFIKSKREDEGMSYKKIANQLNAEGYRTRGGKKFYPATVREVYLRFT